MKKKAITPIKSFDGTLAEARALKLLRYPSRLPADVENEANELIIWADKPSSTDLNEYICSKHYLRKDFEELAQINQYFNDALTYAYVRIGVNLNALWKNDPYKERYCNRFLPRYDAQFKQEFLELQQIKAIADGKTQGVINVIMPAIEQTDVVTKQLEAKK